MEQSRMERVKSYLLWRALPCAGLIMALVTMIWWFNRDWDLEARKELFYKQELINKEIAVLDDKLADLNKEKEKKQFMHNGIQRVLDGEAHMNDIASEYSEKYGETTSLFPTASAKEGEHLGYAVTPDKLFYTCHVDDKCYVTQSDSEHFARNGYLAVDIGTNGNNVSVYAPDWQNKSITYNVKYGYYPATTGRTVELLGEYEGTKFMWRIGHTHHQWGGVDYQAKYNGQTVTTGTEIAFSGGEVGAEDQGATTGKHVHIEYLLWDGTKYAPTPYRIEENINVHKEKTAVESPSTAQVALSTIQDRVDALRGKENPKTNDAGSDNGNTHGGEMFPRSVFFTSYNPEARQTDSSPRIGASGKSMEEGMIALSRDLLYPNSNLPTGYNSGSPIKYGQRVRVTSPNPQCNGEFVVEDTMNKRYKNRGDIFLEERSKNTSCWGIVELI